MSKVVQGDFSDLAKLLRDDELMRAVHESDDPACKRLSRWICHEVLEAVFEGRSYRWPGTGAELHAMFSAAYAAVRRGK